MAISCLDRDGRSHTQHGGQSECVAVILVEFFSSTNSRAAASCPSLYENDARSKTRSGSPLVMSRKYASCDSVGLSCRNDTWL